MYNVHACFISTLVYLMRIYVYYAFVCVHFCIYNVNVVKIQKKSVPRHCLNCPDFTFNALLYSFNALSLF